MTGLRATRRLACKQASLLVQIGATLWLLSSAIKKGAYAPCFIADDWTRTSTLLLEKDFESIASTNSATSAWRVEYELKPILLLLKKLLGGSLGFPRVGLTLSVSRGFEGVLFLIVVPVDVLPFGVLLAQPVLLGGLMAGATE
jgi:hypothetical protein